MTGSAKQSIEPQAKNGLLRRFAPRNDDFCNPRFSPGSSPKGMTKDTGVVRSEGKTLSVGRRAATAEARITDLKGRLLAHATTTCLVFEISKGT
jgi:hypothetical protein